MDKYEDPATEKLPRAHDPWNEMADLEFVYRLAFYEYGWQLTFEKCVEIREKANESCEGLVNSLLTPFTSKLREWPQFVRVAIAEEIERAREPRVATADCDIKARGDLERFVDSAMPHPAEYRLPAVTLDCEVGAWHMAGNVRVIDEVKVLGVALPKGFGSLLGDSLYPNPGNWRWTEGARNG
jgi:hypothetical protein